MGILNSQLATKRRRESVIWDDHGAPLHYTCLVVNRDHDGVQFTATRLKVSSCTHMAWRSGCSPSWHRPFCLRRIMGASWNMLLYQQMANGDARASARLTRIKTGSLADCSPSSSSCFLTMPITALNGISTVLYVMLSAPPNAEEILNYGGIIGYSIFVRIDLISEILFHWEFIKAFPQFLSLYLTLNIAIVGLAFIFELTRNLILGGQSFGGMFGVILDTPREIRAEKSAGHVSSPSHSLDFLATPCCCSSSFVTRNLAISYMTVWLENNGFIEEMRLLTVWLFIAAGQVIFLLTWILSITRFGHLRRLRFDLNPDERREGAVKLEGGDRLQHLVETAAYNEDIDLLLRVQEHDFPGDQALIRQEQSRASMWEKALEDCGLKPSKKVVNFSHNRAETTTRPA